MKLLYISMALLLGVNCFADECPNLTGLYSKCVHEVIDEQGNAHVYDPSWADANKYAISQITENGVTTYSISEIDKHDNISLNRLVVDGKAEERLDDAYSNGLRETYRKWSCEKGVVHLYYKETKMTVDKIWSTTFEQTITYFMNAEDKFVYVTESNKDGQNKRKNIRTCSRE